MFTHLGRRRSAGGAHASDVGRHSRMQNVPPRRQWRQRARTEQVPQASVSEPVPGALVAAGNPVEADAHPGIGELTGPPASFDLKENLTARVALQDAEPFRAELDVA